LAKSVDYLTDHTAYICENLHQSARFTLLCRWDGELSDRTDSFTGCRGVRWPLVIALIVSWRVEAQIIRRLAYALPTTITRLQLSGNVCSEV